MNFEELGLKEELLKGVIEAGFVEPSPIQKDAIPVILQGKDLIAQAQTGTGKTAAFGLGIMNMLNTSVTAEALILTPTRELCMQVSDEIYKLGRFLGIKTVAVYGGQSISRQVDLIGRGAQIVVATPGRLLDHLLNDRLATFAPRFVVLDEADEMLDMGFLDDIEEIFKHLPKERQTLLFSATIPAAIRSLANRTLKDPASIKIESKEVTSENIEQFYYVIEDYERSDAVMRLIDSEDPFKSLIFCRTKKDTDELATMLIAKGYPAKALHGDMDQRQREEAVKNFKAGKIVILVATDVAARGLDISDVTHVFNYHIPLDAESYVHRIGRTGRAGKKGKAITLVSPLEFRELNKIKIGTNAQIYHEEIPTATEVHGKLKTKLIEKIKMQHIDENAVELLKSLADEMDTSTLILKLLSKMLVKNQVAGPFSIGLKGDKLKRMLVRSESDLASGKDRGGRGGGGGRSYGGRGGGDRGGRSYSDRSGGSSFGGGDRSSGGGRSYSDRSGGSSFGGERSGGERTGGFGGGERTGGERSGGFGGDRGGRSGGFGGGDRSSGGGGRSYSDRSGGGYGGDRGGRSGGFGGGDRSGGADRGGRGGGDRGERSGGGDRSGGADRSGGGGADGDKGNSY